MDRQVAVIRGRMAQIGVTQQQIAQAMGLERTLFSRILRGRHPMPEGMEARIHAVLDQLKEKKRVAAEAVEKRVEKRVAELAEAVEKLRAERAELVEAVAKLAEAVEKLAETTLCRCWASWSARVEKLRRDEAK